MVFVCVISKGFIDHRLEEHQQRLNDALSEMQRRAEERRQNEGLLAHEEDKERRLPGKRLARSWAKARRWLQVLVTTIPVVRPCPGWGFMVGIQMGA
ncbi:MAG: hypothetical protein EXS58_04040 [Candidatus Latescibacteria bacterium]|nr:hypothetical protein [Candidatus Latescibacterota bacterium]